MLVRYIGLIYIILNESRVRCTIIWSCDELRQSSQAAGRAELQGREACSFCHLAACVRCFIFFRETASHTGVDDAARATGKRARNLKQDPLLRLIAINGVAGVGVAMLVMGGIFWTNIGNLRVLVAGAEDPVLPVLMLAFALVITLGSVVIGSAIMLLGRKGGNRSGGPRGGRSLRLAWTAAPQSAPAYVSAAPNRSRTRGATR